MTDYTIVFPAALAVGVTVGLFANLIRIRGR